MEIDLERSRDWKMRETKENLRSRKRKKTQLCRHTQVSALKFSQGRCAPISLPSTDSRCLKGQWVLLVHPSGGLQPGLSPVCRVRTGCLASLALLLPHWVPHTVTTLVLLLRRNLAHTPLGSTTPHPLVVLQCSWFYITSLFSFGPSLGNDWWTWFYVLPK